MKKIYLISGILTSAVFIVLIIEIITENADLSQIGFKEIIYLLGWLLLSISSIYQYFKKD